MTRKILVRNLLLATLAVATLVWTFSYALAQVLGESKLVRVEPSTVPCPDNKPCKVLVLSEEQAATLDQIVANTALQGPYAQIHQIVRFYQEMLAKAPAGKVMPAPAQPEPKK